jgi:hypothetical protein
MSMSTTPAVRRALALAAMIVMSALLLPGCDPETLDEDRRQILTGSSDTHNVTLSVAPNEAEVADTVVFEYDVQYAQFSGEVILSLSGLTEDLELVRDLEPRRVRVADASSSAFSGSFALRALRERAEPVEVFLHLASVGATGSRVDHAPAKIRIQVRAPAPSQLDLDCQRDPPAGVAPLLVVFQTRRSGCLGSCSVRWDFGDHTSSAHGDVDHVYREAGEYKAVATLEDATGATATCMRKVSVSPSTTPEAPKPGPTTPGSGLSAFPAGTSTGR